MASLAACEVISHPIRQYIEILIEGCAYACTSNVLKIQKMLHIVSQTIEKKDGDENSNNHQTAALLSIGLIAFGEQIGMDMLKRIINHTDPEVRRTIPLVLTLLGITRPDNPMMDMLSKMTYDTDQQTAINAILAQGIIWSGTNNS